MVRKSREMLLVAISQESRVKAIPLSRISRPPLDLGAASFALVIGNKLGHGGLKDKDLVVPLELGVQGKISGNVLAGDEY
ncbi:hypothetical protein SLEP1_g57100 [Rubroshorea leprosula]|uniref:Uncharacterized protein n=1 Tax=Rubroshorea leprosula TaxID=152421 RepID=A0AAV5MN22_9ROSI|nr:hypothetical protein SLEP1_g57100 [Rubroshorea leprosula]